jgi:SAM-dependent methyltransferase
MRTPPANLQKESPLMFDHAPNTPATLRKLSEIVDEYDEKRKAIAAALETFKRATTDLETAACIGGNWGASIWGRYGNPSISASTRESALLQSAWKHVIAGLNIRDIATAKDLSQLETAMTNPPPFTLDTIRATFGKYLMDPRQHVLRGVAECFCDLDSAYKSHSKVKIGVKGLPQRIIISGALTEWGAGWREGQLKNVLDAMATLHDQPRMGYSEFDLLKKAAKRGDDPEFLGVTVRGFKNGNAHLIFDPAAQLAINKALAEFYGDSLADDAGADNATRQPSTAVSADLAYYPSPVAVVDRVVNHVALRHGYAVLEPSCGDGQMMDGLERESAKRHLDLRVTGVEYHAGRADEARAKGHHVQTANFLQIAPQAIFDAVVMNPPFAGRHYLKHIAHALKFLKPGGHLVAVLPASAWYDHGELPEGGHWEDLPPGSFAESGTNVPTGIWSMSAPGRHNG